MDLYAKLSAQMEEIATSLNSRMAQHEEDLKAVANVEVPHKTIASLSREFTDFRNFVCKTLNALKAQIELLMLGLDRHEMMTRRKVLLLHGVKSQDDPMVTALDVLHNNMKMSDISASNIVACHRLGSNMSKPRPLLIRFERYSMRSEVWKNKTSLKGSGFTLSEFLTKPRHDVFMAARQHFSMRSCWSSDGKIMIQLQDKSMHKIESMAELNRLKAQFPAVVMTTGKALKKPAHGSSTQDTGVMSSSTSDKSRKAVK